MNLSFIINLKEINPILWEQAFKGLKKIARRYPVPLMRLAEVEKLGKPRREWHKNVINSNDGFEDIQLTGDYYTLEYGSAYQVCENIGIQMAKRPEADYAKNAFYLNPKQEYFHCQTGDFNFDLFGNYSTTGLPYTYAVLAMGIYLEHCFYETAYLAGEYNSQQITLVAEWLESLFGHTIHTPKTIAHQTLWEKLSPEYSNAQDAITRFWFLSSRSTKDKISFLLEEDRQALEIFVIKELKHFNSVHQWGARDLLIPYLLACNDLELFLQFFKKVQQVNTVPDFSLLEMLKLLIEQGICQKPFANEMLREFNKERPGLESGMEPLNRLFFKMSGMPDTIDFYADADELLQLFAYYEPQHGKHFKEVIDTEVAKVEAKRKKMNEKLETTVEATLEETATEMETHESDPIFVRSGLANEDYFIQAAIAEKHHYKNFQDLARHIGQSTIDSVKKYKEKFSNTFFERGTTQEYLQAIYKEIYERDFALSEDAWQQMDIQDNLQILQGLLYMASLESREMKFWKMRKAFFETPEVWIFLKDEKDNDVN